MSNDQQIGWELARWRSLAAQDHEMLIAIRRAYSENAKRLDSLYPAWLANINNEPGNPLKQDTRRAYFEIVQVVLRNRQFASLLIREQLTDPEWWSNEGGGFDPGNVLESLGGWATGTQLATFHQLFSITDATLRAILRAKGVNVPTNFSRVVGLFLQYAPLKKYEPLFELVAKIRNTIHNSGLYYPPDWQTNPSPVQISYEGQKFKFEVGKPPATMDYGAVYLIADWLNQAMFEIITSSDVASIPYCPRVQFK